ncbi:MAG: flagellar hook-length control protein FliK [Gammaproteobacteria bacterium]|nr:flagellar hook-length control protein FliK [Gammaproteobacteria bacterium]
MTMNIMSMRVQTGTETGGRIGEGDSAGEHGRFADVLTQQTGSGKSASQTKADHSRQTAAVKPDDADIAASGTAVQDEKTATSTTSPLDETADNRDAEPANTTGPEPSLSSLSTTTPNSTPTTVAAESVQAGESSADDTASDVSAPAASATKADTEDEAAGSDSIKGAATDAADDAWRGSGTESLTLAGRSAITAEPGLSSRQEGGSQLPPTMATKAEQQVAEQQASGKQPADSPSAEQIRKADSAIFEGASGQATAPAKGAREPAVPAPQAAANPDFAGFDEAEGRAEQKQAERIPQEMTAMPLAVSQAGAGQQSKTTSAEGRPKVTAEAAPLDTRRDTADSQTADSLANKDTIVVRQQEAISVRTPEWLAQIEHGRRWSQPDLRAGSPVNNDENGKALPSVTLAEGEGEQQNQAEPVSTSSGAFEPTSASLLPGQSGGEGAAAMNQAPVVQDAGMMVMNRDGIQTGSTSERPALLERVVTLQQGAPEQSAKQLSQQVQVMVNQNLQEAEIRLDPSNLGGLRIQVKMEQGEVQVQFLASHPQARELLDQALPRLRDMLSQQGLNLSQNPGQSGSQQGGFNQAAQQDAQQQSQQDAQQRGDGRSNGPRGYGSLAGNEAQASSVDEARLSSRTDDAGRIDFFA